MHTHSTPNPGQYGFRAKFVESQDARTRGNIWAYLEELNTLVVQPKCDFPVTFAMDKPLPPNCHVRAVMCFKHTSDIQRYGPVTRCIDHLEKDKSECMPSVGQCSILHWGYTAKLAHCRR